MEEEKNLYDSYEDLIHLLESGAGAGFRGLCRRIGVDSGKLDNFIRTELGFSGRELAGAYIRHRLLTLFRIG
ncbi:MAG: hypothetical protein HUJ94_05030 [Bacteroidales bacterium]|nr:hypothetical protein [Bacteroidales bacterium]